MWIEDLPNGKFKYNERYTDLKTGKQRKVSTTLTANSPQARKKAIQILNKKIEASLNKKDTQVYTFEQAFNFYYDYKEKRWSPATRISNKSIYNNHIEPYNFKHYLMDKIALSDVQEVVDTVQVEKKLSERTANIVKSLIVAVFRHVAVHYDLKNDLDWREIEISPDLSNPTIDFIDSSDLPNELAKMREIMNEIEADIIETQILTGMRIGEVSALTENDWNGQTIRINKSTDSIDGNKIKEAKNKSSIRNITSNDRVNEIFTKRIKMNRILFGDKANLIFATSNNTPYNLRNINRSLKKVNPDYSTHTMRHTHASLLAENDFPLKYTMDRLGHTNPKTTLKIYTHISEKLQKKGQEKLNNLF